MSYLQGPILHHSSFFSSAFSNELERDDSVKVIT